MPAPLNPQLLPLQRQTTFSLARSTLNLGSNRLEGGLPEAWGALSQLTDLNLGNNLLNGSLQPAVLASWRQMRELNLEVNEFEGELGGELCRFMPNLRYLALRFNRFSGSISLDGCFNLTNVNIEYNRCVAGRYRVHVIGHACAIVRGIATNGVVCGGAPLLSGVVLFVLLYLCCKPSHCALCTCRFSGPLPVSADLQQAVIFRASNNFFSGPLPDGLYDMRNLDVILFDNNRIRGSISPRIGQLQRLSAFVANHNELSGLPQELFQISSLFRVELVGNQLNGTLPDSVGEAHALRILLLRDNLGLTGEPLTALMGTAYNVSQSF